MLVTDSCLIGVEIKSDADTYARLDKQVKEYNRCFDKNYVVVGSKHANHVEEHVPEWWGIITVEENNAKPDFYLLREPKLNPRNHYEFFRKRQLAFLWRPELFHILVRFGFPKYAYKSKKFVQDYIYEHIEEGALKAEITYELFERDYSKTIEEIEEYKKAKAEKVAGKVKKARKSRKPRK